MNAFYLLLLFISFSFMLFSVNMHSVNIATECLLITTTAWAMMAEEINKIYS